MPDLSQTGLISYHEASAGTTSLGSGVWHINSEKRHAFAIYSDFDALDEVNEKITTRPAEDVNTSINLFSDKDGVEKFRTKEVADDVGGEDIELDLDDRIVTFVVDQSGSMSWNDNNQLRHTVARRVINRLASTYPGDITYNVVKYQGTPIQTTLFAVLQENAVAEDDPVAIARTFFGNSEHNFSGIRVVRKEGEYPQNPIDGEVVSEGLFISTFDDELEEDTTYYYKVYTFDNDFVFSDGVEIKVTPRTRVIPRGVSNFSEEVLAGSGVTKDSNTIGLWHIDEGVGTTAYDFSDSKIGLTHSETSPVWIDKSETPVGVSGMRFDGTNTSFSSGSTTSVSIGDQITIMGWILPFDSTTARTIAARQSSSATNYIFSTNTSNGLTFSVDGSTSFSSDPNTVTDDTWQHVAVTADLTSNNVRFYVDGIQVGGGSLPSVSTNSTDAMNFDIGYDRRSSLGRFFGRLTEISVHDVVRNNEYIAGYSLIDEDNRSPDNSDRLVILSYDIPEDFNFPGGEVLIVKNAFRIPTWEEDGDAFATIDASSGSFAIMDTDDFLLNNNYYYRAFSKNTTGNYSYLEDSPLVDAFIPRTLAMEKLPALDPPLGVPVNFSAQPGNKKVFLTWNNITTDTRIRRIRVYHSISGPPSIDAFDISSEQFIFEGDLDDEQFVHRDLDNARTHYYSIVAIDQFSRSSDPVNVQVVPLSSSDDSSFPLLEVKDIGYNLISNTSISVNWTNPIDFKSNISTFFGRTVLFYGSVTDEFGQPITDNTEVLLDIIPTINKVPTGDDVFSLDDPADFDDEDVFEFSSTLDSQGVIRGVLKLTSNVNILTRIDSAFFQVRIRSFVPDLTSEIGDDGEHERRIFEFLSESVRVGFDNPWEADISNRDERKIKEECKSSFSGAEADFIKSNLPGFADEDGSFDGAYIRSTIPFVARVNMTFENEPVGEGTIVRAKVFDATMDLCSDEDPLRLGVSKAVIPPKDIQVIRDTVEELDENGEIISGGEAVSFADIPLNVPYLPQAILLYVEVNYQGYKSQFEMYIVFQNILKIELTAKAPVIDGIDEAEQQAAVYLLDPDNPEVVENVTQLSLDDPAALLGLNGIIGPQDSGQIEVPEGAIPVDDFTVAKWELIKKEFGKDRPFFSRDSVPIPNGVYSYVRTGVAKQIFFGPVSDVQANVIQDPLTGEETIVGEIYDVRIDIMYDGLTATAIEELKLTPESDKNEYIPARFLMEFPLYTNSIWADGFDYEKLLISRNASTSGTNRSSCFLTCSTQSDTKFISPNLNEGQVIEIVAIDERTEILWGDVTESIDPYTGINTLILGDDVNTAMGTALVELTDENPMPVFFRVNAFFPNPPKTSGGSITSIGDLEGNPCECLGIKSSKGGTSDDIGISGETLILVDDIPVRATGGGGNMLSAIPPTILTPKEPLAISVVDKRVDGVSTSDFVFDGSAINEIVLEVSFSGRPVPDGTPVTLSLFNGEDSVFTLQDETIFTQQRIDSAIDADTLKSYAHIVFAPVSPQQTVLESIKATSTYDQSGLVKREMSVCIIVKLTQGDFKKSDTITDIFSGALERYDISLTSGSWESKSSMINPRGDIVLENVGDKLYAIGGLSSAAISKFVEEYDPSTDAWLPKTGMVTPRFSSMSVVFNSKIYVIGGITAGFLANNLTTTAATEVYDPATDTWEVLADMPFPLTMGVAHYMSVGGEDRIYVLCGMQEITEDGEIEIVNDSVIYYDIDNDEWVVDSSFSDLELALFQRLSPGSFVVGNKVQVFGGAIEIILEHIPVTGLAEQETGKKLIYPTDSFSYNVATKEIDITDGDIDLLPRPRFRTRYDSSGNNHFLVGGSDNTTQTLKTFEKIDTSSSDYALTRLPDLTNGKASAGIAIADDAGTDYLYLAGGYKSGRSSGFLQFRTEINTGGVLSRMRLDGKQSVSVDIDLVDEGGTVPTGDITIKVRGFIEILDSNGRPITGQPEGAQAVAALEENTEASQKVAADTVMDATAVYPVLFTQQEVVAKNGKATVTLLPRAEDLLRALALNEEGEIEVAQASATATTGSTEDADVELQVVEGVERVPYVLAVELTVINDTYYGQTITKSILDAEASQTGVGVLTGSVPDVIFVVDASTSVLNDFEGVSVGDFNGDGTENTILDAQLAAFSAINQQLIDGELGADARVAIVTFNSTASILDMSSVDSKIKFFAHPLDDENSDFEEDVNIALRSISVSEGSNYKAALAKTIELVKLMGTSSENGNVIFMSDGASDALDYQDEANELDSLVSNVQAFGVGPNANLTSLQIIDPNARTFERADALFDALGVLGNVAKQCKKSVNVGVSMEWTELSVGISLANIEVLRNEVNQFTADDGASLFSVLPGALAQLEDPRVETFSDIEWIPQVITEVGNNAGSSQEVLNIITNLENTIPFGASAMLDSLDEAAQILSDNDVDGITKSSYLFCDNESNMSRKTLDEVVELWRVIEQEGETPLVISSFSVVSPPTLSSALNTVDSDELETLANETGGNVITVLSGDFEDETVNLFAGQVTGSMGYGEYQFIWDIGSIVEINKISALFELFTNTNGSWKISVSDDGYTYTEIEDTFNPNVEVAFANLLTRFIKFEIVLITGFSAFTDAEYELIPLPASPAMTRIEVEYSLPNENLLLLEDLSTSTVPQQVVVAVDAINTTNNEIVSGVAKSDSGNWLDYQNDAQLQIGQNGKIFIPVRFGEENADREKLISINRFTFRTHFERWDPDSVIILYDSDGNQISSDSFTAYAREGMIVFDSIPTGDVYIDIRNQAVLKVGLRITNRSQVAPVDITGVGYMYSTNANLLPPVQAIPPVAVNVIISPDEPTSFTALTASYSFNDINDDDEVIDERVIRWYINGVRREYLDDLVTWNDLTNRVDPIFTNVFTFDTTSLTTENEIIAAARRNGQFILKKDDKVYYTLQVSDGNSVSILHKSEIVTIAEHPPTIESVTIKGKTPTGKVKATVTANDSAFVDFALLADGLSGSPRITWTVNGEEFKTGSVSIVPGISEIEADEINDFGTIGIAFNNSLVVTVTPETDGASGEELASEELVVQNAIPEVDNVIVTPSSPSTSHTLNLFFQFNDADIDQGDATQSNESIIKWFFADASTGNDFQEVSELEGELNVPSTLTSRGQRWRATVEPFDGLDSGITVSSNIVTIR